MKNVNHKTDKVRQTQSWKQWLFKNITREIRKLNLLRNQFSYYQQLALIER